MDAVEAKRKKVYDYCIRTKCSACVLNADKGCLSIADATECELNEALKKIDASLEAFETPEGALDGLIVKMLHAYDWIETRPEEFANTLKTLWELRK